MFSDRYQITLPLEVVTPLHIGSGLFRPEPRRAHEQRGKKVTPEVATVVKDHLGKPYIPGTTLKGILRSLVHENKVTEQLFGTSEALTDQEADDPQALMAQAYFLNAYIDKLSIPARSKKPNNQLPLYNQNSATAVMARNAIDGMTGVALDKHLFFLEIVPPGVRFEMRLTLFTKKKRALYLLAELLQWLGDAQGVPFGRHQSAGFGRVRALLDALKVEQYSLDKSGQLIRDIVNLPELSEAIAAPSYIPERITRSVNLKLRCQGPFIVVGERTESQQPDSSEEHGAQLQPLKLSENEPWLPGTSLKGVLRSESLWLVARERLRRGEVVMMRSELDDRTKVLNPRSHQKGSVTDVEQLSTVERLFGIAGWRGQLQVGQIRLCNNPKEIDLTSVRLDRFSGGPIDNALFTTRALLKPEFEVVLGIEERGELKHTKVVELFEQLIQHVCNKGLVLGHGGNKGFGWFDVTCITTEEEN